MDDPSQLSKIAGGVRALTIAVWCLVAINVIQVAAWLVPMLAPEFYMRRFATASGVPSERLESWEGLALEEKLKRSTVVLITENKREGDKIKAIIKDIPKHDPDTTFHYALGDEYRPLSATIRENTTYGEGAIVLLQGSPASMRESYSIYNGSISGLGDMPLEKVYRLIEQSR